MGADCNPLLRGDEQEELVSQPLSQWSDTGGQELYTPLNIALGMPESTSSLLFKSHRLYLVFTVGRGGQRIYKGYLMISDPSAGRDDRDTGGNFSLYYLSLRLIDLADRLCYPVSLHPKEFRKFRRFFI